MATDKRVIRMPVTSPYAHTRPAAAEEAAAKESAPAEAAAVEGQRRPKQQRRRGSSGGEEAGTFARMLVAAVLAFLAGMFTQKCLDKKEVSNTIDDKRRRWTTPHAKEKRT